jgi:hypothetical protein
MSTEKTDFAIIASRHGIDLSMVQPLSLPVRLVELERCSARQDVPYPILPEHAKPCFAAARAGKPFTVGTLSGDTVDVGQYRNAQAGKKRLKLVGRSFRISICTSPESFNRQVGNWRRSA